MAPQFFGKKSDVMVKVPVALKKEAKMGIDLSKKGFEGGVETGFKRARQLINNEYIPIEDLFFMRNWYARHYYTSGPGFKKWIDKNKNDKLFKKDQLRGAVAILIWGGKSGFDWVFNKKNTSLLENHFNKKFSVKPGEL